ncbi:MAG: DUF4215 domain-containing protein, partial [bacterium]|nr:DUF4215 domain-containing protein [bacterium]
DGVVVGDELCDGIPGCDACDSPYPNWVCDETLLVNYCESAPGWTCELTSPYPCEPICGDGILLGDETCDHVAGCMGPGE